VESPDAYPDYPDNPHNHRYTLSYDPQKPPFLVVRANTVSELQDAFEELEEGGVYAAMGNAWRVMKAQASIGAGLGPTTPVPAPAGPPAQPTPPAPQAPNYNPQMPGPGVPGTAPAAWQNVGAPTPPAPQAPQVGQWQGNGGGQGSRGPKPRPMDWGQVYKIDVPYQQKEAFKAFREQYKDAFKGKIAWAGGGAYWVHPEVVQSFANYSPVPA
jgi:hypothetical protein